MNELLKTIQERQSARVPFNPKRAIPRQELDLILEAARWAPTPHNMQNYEIMVVDDRQLLDKIAAIPHTVSLDFVRENYQQLSFSEQELKQRKTGIMGTMFPPAWQKPDPKPEDIPPAAGGTMPECPALLIVLYDPRKRAPASQGDFLGIMGLGCVLENMWLMANSRGIALHIQSYLSQPNMEKQVLDILHVPGDQRIAIAFRLGYAEVPAGYLRVRRDIRDFAHHNLFGTRWIE
jgi:nitroreductase